MDNIKFGAFISQLRKEQGLTQKELADKVNVTDKAISKWETGKGFPDIKMLEPLAQALGVTLVELIQGERLQQESLTVDEAESMISQAMDQSQKITARRYLKLLRWLLTMITLFLLYRPLVFLVVMVWFRVHISLHSDSLGVIGGADGPTAIITNSCFSSIPDWCILLFLAGISIICIVLIFRIRKLEKGLE